MGKSAYGCSGVVREARLPFVHDLSLPCGCLAHCFKFVLTAGDVFVC